MCERTRVGEACLFDIWTIFYCAHTTRIYSHAERAARIRFRFARVPKTYLLHTTRIFVRNMIYVCFCYSLCSKCVFANVGCCNAITVYSVCELVLSAASTVRSNEHIAHIPSLSFHGERKTKHFWPKLLAGKIQKRRYYPKACWNVYQPFNKSMRLNSANFLLCMK